MQRFPTASSGTAGGSTGTVSTGAAEGSTGTVSTGALANKFTAKHERPTYHHTVSVTKEFLALPGMPDRPGSSDHGPHATLIRAALYESRDTPQAQVLVVGYSPTGGGHTDRCLNVVRYALDQGYLPPGSTVILNVPEKWTRTRDGTAEARPDSLAKLCAKLHAKGVNCVLAGAEKSVVGYLNEDGSDDAAIVARFGRMPKRPRAQVKSIVSCKLFGPDDRGSTESAVASSTQPASSKNTEDNGKAVETATAQLSDCYERWDIQNVPTISAKDLAGTLKGILGDNLFANRERVRVFCDMDPALAKAFHQYGCGRIVDQQNHPILLTFEGHVKWDTWANNSPENSILGKVLSGNAQVSYIGLGEKNTLTSTGTLAEHLGISPQTTKADARNKVVAYVLENGKELASGGEVRLPADGSAARGYLRHPSATGAEHIENIVVVYAHKLTNQICRHIAAELKKGKFDWYKKTLFLFAGQGAVHGADAMKLAVIGDACTIATCGAGVVGETIFRHKSCGSKARFLALPIKGHNEQERNAAYAEKLQPTGRVYITTISDTTRLDDDVSGFVWRSYEDRNTKYEGNMSAMLSDKGVNSNETYVTQAADILFPKGDVPDFFRHIAKIEENMRDSALLRLNRKFIKLVFQALEVCETRLEKGEPLEQAFEVRFAQKDDRAIVFQGLQQFRNEIENDRIVELLEGIRKEPLSLTGKTETEKQEWLSPPGTARQQPTIKANDLVCLSDTRAHFQVLGYPGSTSKQQLDVVRHLKNVFGEHLTTGF